MQYEVRAPVGRCSNPQQQLVGVVLQEPQRTQHSLFTQTTGGVGIQLRAGGENLAPLLPTYGLKNRDSPSDLMQLIRRVAHLQGCSGCLSN